MDGLANEHSDSDSGDSWTLLDNSTGDDISRATKCEIENNVADNHEKDEDTDGISIISDSDLESPTFFEVGINNTAFVSPDAELNHLVDSSTTQFIPINSQSSTKSTNLQNDHEPLKIEKDFGDKNTIHKIYVHRRNKRISTVLNIIMLGSIITAAGVAIGHMWGVRNDCSTHTMPSVNKILSNLYKLQEENAYLRNKLKELTSVNHIGYLQKNPYKQNKCKKVFEESLSLNNNNVKQVTKCVDDKANNINKISIDKQFEQPEFEKDFIGDIDKLKAVYIQNKSLLDEEIVRRYKRENKAMKNVKTHNVFKLNKINEEKRSDENIFRNIEQQNRTPSMYKEVVSNEHTDENDLKRKISYADSLKTHTDNNNLKQENKKNNESKIKYSSKIPKLEIDNDINKVMSEEDFKKDNRYTGQKHKHDKQKHDRHKTNKKQKRRNKYEQWEMNGGLLKDYDESSVLSANDNDFLYNSFDNEFNQDNKEKSPIDNMNVNKAPEVLENNYHKSTKPKNNLSRQSNLNKIGKKTNWYEERVFLRNEARKKLEHELFGETKPNSANWYFRRMHKREQCRAKPENITYKKSPKHSMNFKTKF